MPRQLRLEYPGAIYHLMNRGNRRGDVFRDNYDRERYLQTLGETCQKTAWEVHAYCLMDNQLHLVVETPQANLVAGMKWLLGTYTGRFNRRHRLTGHLFSGRYKSLLVDGSGDGYLRAVCDYVHLNPVRANLLGDDQPLSQYRWSSYGQYLKPARSRVSWLRVDRLFGEMGIPKDSPAGRRQFERRMEERRWEENEEQWRKVRRGWCLGEEEFRQELLEQVREKMGSSHTGKERKEAAEEKARRMVREELSNLGWTNQELERRRKGDREKVRIARRLRHETTVSLKWIAACLVMGTWTYVANCIYQT